jgi:trigger factor
VQYALTVAEVRCKEIPAVDEAFCKSVGVKDEADLRDQLRKGITGTKEQAAETARREKALDALIAGLDLPLPQSAVDSVANGLFNEYLQLRIRNGTLKPEQFEAQREEIITESRKAAETKVRAQVVLVRIAEENGIDLTREEFTQAILREAYRTNVQPEKLAKDRNQLQVLRRDAVLNKALDLVLDGKAPEAVEKA